jgi:hypothetical protein
MNEVEEKEFEVIFVGDALEPTFAFLKELTKTFDGDKLPTFTVSSFSNSGHIMVYCGFDGLMEAEQPLIQAMVNNRIPHVKILNLMVLTPERQQKYKDELLKGDNIFTGYVQLDLAKAIIKQRWNGQ